MYRYTQRAGRRARYPWYRYTSVALGLPPQCSRATVKAHNNGEFILTGWSDTHIDQIPTQEPAWIPPFQSLTALDLMLPHYRGNTHQA